MTWEIHGRFVVVATDEEEAEKALRSLERVAKSARAAVTVHVHVSEANASSPERS